MIRTKNSVFKRTDAVQAFKSIFLYLVWIFELSGRATNKPKKLLWNCACLFWVRHELMYCVLLCTDLLFCEHSSHHVRSVTLTNVSCCTWMWFHLIYAVHQHQVYGTCDVICGSTRPSNLVTSSQQHIAFWIKNQTLISKTYLYNQIPVYKQNLITHQPNYSNVYLDRKFD